MRVFLLAYWHDVRFKKKIGGPIKIYELASNLTELGHSVFLFIPKIGYPELQTKALVVPIPLVDLPILRFVSFQILSIIMSFKVMSKKGLPDIVYVRIMWSFLPMLLGKFLRIPAILEVNDSPHRGYAAIKNGLKRKLVHMIDRISYRLSDHILPVTQKIAEDLHRIEGVPWNIMTVIPSGTNTDLFRPLDKAYCCEKLGFDSDLKYVGFTGTFFQYQGIHVLIKSAQHIIQEFTDVRFLIVGDGPQKLTWENMVREMSLNNYFIFTGQVDYSEVPYYCGVMDVCVSPLLKEAMESSAVKVFDYLACGKPVVMSDISNTGQQFIESGAVILVSPENPVELANAIHSLLSHMEGMKAIGRKGREFVVAKYDRQKLAENIYKLCLKAVNHSYS